MKFSQTLRLTDQELVITRRHEAWMSGQDDLVYTTGALSFAAEQLRAKDRIREGTISASSLGGCMREQQFTYLGMPKMPHSPQSLMRMANGRFMHLRWQMAGLSEGWLPRAEVPVGDNPYRLSGTMDGIVYDESVLELKSINSHGFSRVVSFGPLIPHLFQMATYLMCTERDRGLFVYECKDNQEYREIAVGRDQLPLDLARYKAEDLWAANEAHKLIEPLDKCLDRQGWEYEYCPFRDRCLGIHDWEEANAGKD